MTEYKYDELTLVGSAYNTKVSVEISRESNVYEVFDAVRTLIIGLGYLSKSFDDAVVHYYQEKNLENADDNDT